MTTQIKVGVFGTHSTGKTSFLNAVRDAFAEKGITAVRIPSLASTAKEIGFPVLKQHTFESTLWLMTKCITLELEDRTSPVLLVDRPPIDALGYLLAALEYRKEKIPVKEQQYLFDLARHHSQKYNVLAYSKLDRTKPIDNSKPRDLDIQFRSLVDLKYQQIIPLIAPHSCLLTENRRKQTIDEILNISSAA